MYDSDAVFETACVCSHRSLCSIWAAPRTDTRVEELCSLQTGFWLLDTASGESQFTACFNVMMWEGGLI